MQNSVLSVLMVLLLFGCSNNDKKSFTVSGTLQNASSNVVYIEESNLTTGEKKVKDSAGIHFQ